MRVRRSCRQTFRSWSQCGKSALGSADHDSISLTQFRPLAPCPGPGKRFPFGSCRVSWATAGMESRTSNKAAEVFTESPSTVSARASVDSQDLADAIQNQVSRKVADDASTNGIVLFGQILTEQRERRGRGGEVAD